MDNLIIFAAQREQALRLEWAERLSRRPVMEAAPAAGAARRERLAALLLAVANRLTPSAPAPVAVTLVTAPPTT